MNEDLISRRLAIDSIMAAGKIGKLTCCDILRKLPSAQPEIVRCKDCKYGSPNGEYGCRVYHFKLYEKHEMNADDFCSRAERREE